MKKYLSMLILTAITLYCEAQSSIMHEMAEENGHGSFIDDLSMTLDGIVFIGGGILTLMCTEKFGWKIAALILILFGILMIVGNR